MMASNTQVSRGLPLSGKMGTAHPLITGETSQPKRLASQTAGNTIMPTPNKSNPKGVATVARQVVNGALATVISIVIPDEGGWAAEKDGTRYFVPVKARSKEKDENGLFPLLVDANGEQLYAMTDGTNVPKAEVLQLDGRTVLNRHPKTGDVLNPNKPAPLIEWKQATPHMDFRKRVVDDTVLFSDGKMRDLQIQVKANNPQTPEEFRESRKAATKTRASNTIAAMSMEDLEAALAAKKASIQAENK